MHICLFIENTHPNKSLNLNVGGISNQILNLLPSYEKYQHLTISLFTKYSEYEPINKNTRIFRISKFKNHKIDTIFFILTSLFKLIKIHKKKPFNLINIHTFSTILIPPFIFKLLFKVPILLKIPLDFSSFINQYNMIKNHNIVSRLITFSWFNFFKKFLIKKIDYIRAINDKIYNDLIKLNFPRNNILRIPNGINYKLFINFKKKKHQNTNFGYVGRLTEFKNLKFLLEEFKNFLNKYPNEKLFFYGEGSEKIYILNFIKKY
ncbi:MAG: glycosyltransferase, partial [Candidatus Lokiarchaeia archaeon]